MSGSEVCGLRSRSSPSTRCLLSIGVAKRFAAEPLFAETTQEVEFDGRAGEVDTVNTSRSPSLIAKPRRFLRAPKSLRQVFLSLIRVAERFANRWYPYAIAVGLGVLPLLLSAITKVPGHQWLTAVLLSSLMLGFVRHDRWLTAFACIALVFLSHSATAILLAVYTPEQVQSVLPQAADYWEKQRTWITTGVDPEYEVMTWLPAHVGLAFGTVLFTVSSLGVIVFAEGLKQVDMMNFYVAQLAGISENRSIAFGLGWHCWSLMRGIGLLLLTIECLSLTVSWALGEEFSRPQVRWLRRILAMGFLVGDGVIKFFCTETIRSMLEENIDLPA